MEPSATSSGDQKLVSSGSGGAGPVASGEVPAAETRRSTRRRQAAVPSTSAAGETAHKRKDQEASLHDNKKKEAQNPSSQACKHCGLLKDQWVLHIPRAEGADMEEIGAICDESLTVGCDSDDMAGGFPMKLINYEMFCPAGHLCGLETVTKSKSTFFMSGTLKHITCEDEDSEGGVPLLKLGPINEWYFLSYDGGTKPCVWVSTILGEYCLGESAPQFQPFMAELDAKLYLAKAVIEYLLEEENMEASFADLLTYLESQVVPATGRCITEEELLGHAEFICLEYLESVIEENFQLTPTKRLEIYPCLGEIMALGNVAIKDLEEQLDKRAKSKSSRVAVQDRDHTKATTTPLVEHMFLELFPQQMQLTNQGTVKPVTATKRRKTMKLPSATTKDTTFTWGKRVTATQPGYFGELVRTDKMLDGSRHHTIFRVGDSVTVHSQEAKEPPSIGTIVYMAGGPSDKQIHLLTHLRASDSFLREAADPNELFYTGKCVQLPPQRLGCKVALEERHPDPVAWRLQGGGPVPPAPERDLYFMTYRCAEGELRLTTAPRLISTGGEAAVTHCPACTEQEQLADEKTPKLVKSEDGSCCTVVLGNLTLILGSCVFIEAETHKFRIPKSRKRHEAAVVEEECDKEMFPEAHRKKKRASEAMEVNNLYQVARVVGIGTAGNRVPASAKEVILSLAMFYRPDDLTTNDLSQKNVDRNLLYWGTETCEVTLADVKGKCFVAPLASISSTPLQWSRGGPFRYYYSQAFNPSKKSFKTVAKTCELVVDPLQYQQLEEAEDYPPVSKPLQSMDIFSGCGGLTRGLEDSGVAQCAWAVERDPAAAEAFRQNFPHSIVLEGDVNCLLAAAMAREGPSSSSSSSCRDVARRLPSKGGVEMLTGGPPCQGFSGMNRFSRGDYSKLKCSLVVTYMAYVEYYRPRFVLLENVRNMVQYEGGTLIKLLLACFAKIGYQCNVAVLQAGSFGVPQKRRRAIILAAGPGEIMPNFPGALYEVSCKDLQLAITINGKKYESALSKGAGLARIRVGDTLDDLPAILNGEERLVRPYGKKPRTFYQRMMREGVPEDQLKDHICRKISSLNLARLQRIPKEPSADWRDLPNIEVQLDNGKTTKKLKYYSFRDGKKLVQGVCPCVVGGGAPCEALAYSQTDTLIPWCLPHTSARNGQWAGLYGRLDPNGFFPTTITNPQPMGKQGCVVHPTQDRLVSVRECARSQGFADSFKFHGTVAQKYCQIGNAVPPPMAAALGLAIRGSVGVVSSSAPAGKRT